MSVSANGEPWPKGVTPRPSPCASAAHGSRGVYEDPAEAIKVIVTDIGIMMRRKGAAEALHQTQQIEEIDKELKKQHQKLQWVLECRNGMVVEEAEEVAQALERGADQDVLEEVGDLLFAAVNLARRAGVHPTTALARANKKFQGRFERVEQEARSRGITLADAGLEALDALWEQVKEEEETG